MCLPGRPSVILPPHKLTQARRPTLMSAIGFCRGSFSPIHAGPASQPLSYEEWESALCFQIRAICFFFFLQQCFTKGAQIYNLSPLFLMGSRSAFPLDDIRMITLHNRRKSDMQFVEAVPCKAESVFCCIFPLNTDSLSLLNTKLPSFCWSFDCHDGTMTAFPWAFIQPFFL